MKKSAAVAAFLLVLSSHALAQTVVHHTYYCAPAAAETTITAGVEGDFLTNNSSSVYIQITQLTKGGFVLYGDSLPDSSLWTVLGSCGTDNDGAEIWDSLYTFAIECDTTYLQNPAAWPKGKLIGDSIPGIPIISNLHMRKYNRVAFRVNWKVLERWNPVDTLGLSFRFADFGDTPKHTSTTPKFRIDVICKP